PNIPIRFGARVGEKLMLMFLEVSEGTARVRQFPFTIAGVFEGGIAEYDSGLVLVNFIDASDLRGLDGLPEGLAVQLDEPLDHARFRAAATAAFPELEYSDWAEE